MGDALNRSFLFSAVLLQEQMYRFAEFMFTTA